MASTNKTPNLGLSQFLPLDKPAWLGDYNQDMSKIDTAVHNVQTQADSMETNVQVAITSADAATKAAQAATEAAAEATSVAQNAQTTANNVSGTATQALTLAQQAQEAAESAESGVEDCFNLFSSNATANGVIEGQPKTERGVTSANISILVGVDTKTKATHIKGTGNFGIIAGSFTLGGGAQMSQITTLATLSTTSKGISVYNNTMGMVLASNGTWYPVQVRISLKNSSGTLDVTKFVGVNYPSSAYTLLVFVI